MKAKTIAHNVFYLAAGGLVTRFLFIVVELLIARHLGPEGFGRFSTALAFTTIASYLFNFGLDFHLVKAFSTRPETRRWVFGNTLMIKGIYTAVIYAAMIGVARWLDYDPTTMVLIHLLGWFNVMLAFEETFAAVFQADERMGRISIYRAVQAALLLGAVATGVALERGIVFFAVASLCAATPCAATWFADAVRRCPPRLKPEKTAFILRHSWMFGLAALFFMLNYRLDMVMLSVMKTPAQVGFYSAAYKFIDVFIKVPIILSIAMLPALYRSAADNDGRALFAYRRVTRYLLSLGVPLAFFLAVFAPSLLDRFFGGGFESGAPALRILAAALFFTFIASPASDQLNAAGRQDSILLAWFLVTVLNATLNVLLIPSRGIAGAAWATLASQGALFLLLTGIGARGAHLRPPVGAAVKPLIASGAFALGALLLPVPIAPVAWWCIAPAVYAGLLVALRFFDSTDIDMVRTLLRRGGGDNG